MVASIKSLFAVLATSYSSLCLGIRILHHLSGHSPEVEVDEQIEKCSNAEVKHESIVCASDVKDSTIERDALEKSIGGHHEEKSSRSSLIKEENNDFRVIINEDGDVLPAVDYDKSTISAYQCLSAATEEGTKVKAVLTSNANFKQNKRSGLRTVCLPRILTLGECGCLANEFMILFEAFRNCEEYLLSDTLKSVQYCQTSFADILTYYPDEKNIDQNQDNQDMDKELLMSLTTVQLHLRNLLSNLISRGLLFTKKQQIHERKRYLFKIACRLPNDLSDPETVNLDATNIKMPESLTASSLHYCVIPLQNNIDMIVQSNDNDSDDGDRIKLLSGAAAKVSDGYSCLIHLPELDARSEWMWIFVLCEEAVGPCLEHEGSACKTSVSSNLKVNNFGTRTSGNSLVSKSGTHRSAVLEDYSPSRKEVRKERRKEKKRLFKEAKRERELERKIEEPSAEEQERQRLERQREHKSIPVDLQMFQMANQKGALANEKSDVQSTEVYLHKDKSSFLCSEDGMQTKDSCGNLDPRITPMVEKMHVHSVYDTIAQHWHGTRYKPWPKVAQFIDNLPHFSIVADIGCGNGKNIPACNEFGICIGSDISLPLCEICTSLKFEAMAADCLMLPYRPEQFDAVLCIAVMHHLSTESRRLRCVEEAGRILLVGGRMLIYAWAYEQHESKSAHRFASQDVLVPWHLRDNGDESRAASMKPDSKRGTNSTTYYNDCSIQQQENSRNYAEMADENKVPSVPDVSIYQRYCHVYVHGELESLVRRAGDGRLFQIDSSYYDCGNWCVVCTKVGS